MSTTEFQDQVKRYYRLSQQIEDAKRERTELRDQIIAFIKKHQFEKKNFIIGDRILRYTQNHTGNLTQKLVLEGLIDYLKDPQEAKKVLSLILDKRKFTQSESIILNKRK